MPFDILIRENATGEVRRKTEDASWADEGSIWYYTEGNGSCDCNLRMNFARAGGATEEEVWQIESDCGDGAFSVLKAVLPDGSERVIAD